MSSTSTRLAGTKRRRLRVNKTLNSKGAVGREPPRSPGPGEARAGARRGRRPLLYHSPPIVRPARFAPEHVQPDCAAHSRQQALRQDRGAARGRPRDRRRGVRRTRRGERRRQDDADQVRPRLLRDRWRHDRALRDPAYPAPLARAARISPGTLRAALLPHRPRLPLFRAAPAATSVRRGRVDRDAGIARPRCEPPRATGQVVLEGNDAEARTRRVLPLPARSLRPRRADERPRPEGARAPESAARPAAGRRPDPVLYVTCPRGHRRSLRSHGRPAPRCAVFLRNAASPVRPLWREFDGARLPPLYRDVPRCLTPSLHRAF